LYRRASQSLEPRNKYEKFIFGSVLWLLVGNVLMVLISLLPVGLIQAWASVEYGTWYARSSEFLQTPTMNTLRWLRVIGDSIFAFGTLVLGWFVLGLVTGHSYAEHGFVREGQWEVEEEPVEKH
jgi:nitric oxide reductase subunit B